MKDKKSIIILYSKGLYDTHALRLADTLKSIGKDCHVLAIGDDEYSNFGRSKTARGCYKFSIRNVRWMYSVYSTLTAKKKAPTKALKNIKADPTERTGLNKFTYALTSRYYKVKNILRRFEPDIVLCFTPSVMKAAIKANEQLRMYTTKVYGCLTDFALDMRFFNRRAAGYLVQNNDIRKQLMAAGIEDHKIFVTSIITDEVVEMDKAVLKQQIGIRNDKPCVLLIGGRYGANILKTAFSVLLNYTDHFNIIMMTGGSDTIISMARCIAKDRADSVFVVDKIDNMAKMYNVADIVVATPTTCICSEVLSYNKPLVLLKGAGHVEIDNTKYLLSHNFALDGTSKKKLLLALSDVILNGVNLAGLGKYAENGSLNDVAEMILDRAADIFAEKKILLAEQEFSDAENAEDYVIEEIDDNVDIDIPKEDVVIDDNNDIEEK